MQILLVSPNFGILRKEYSLQQCWYLFIIAINIYNQLSEAKH